MTTITLAFTVTVTRHDSLSGVLNRKIPLWGIIGYRRHDIFQYAVFGSLRATLTKLRGTAPHVQRAACISVVPHIEGLPSNIEVGRCQFQLQIKAGGR